MFTIGPLHCELLAGREETAVHFICWWHECSGWSLICASIGRRTGLCLPDANVSLSHSPSVAAASCARPFRSDFSFEGRLSTSCWGCDNEAAGRGHYLSALCNQSQEESEIMPMFGRHFGSVSTGKKVYSCMWLSLFMFHVCVHLQNTADCSLTLTKTQLRGLFASYRNGLSGHLRLPCWCK